MTTKLVKGTFISISICFMMIITIAASYSIYVVEPVSSTQKIETCYTGEENIITKESNFTFEKLCIEESHTYEILLQKSEEISLQKYQVKINEETVDMTNLEKTQIEENTYYILAKDTASSSLEVNFQIDSDLELENYGKILVLNEIDE